MRAAVLLLCSFCCLASVSAVAEQADKVIVAHRGASGYLPEHTLQSAAMAHGFDVDFVEPDVVLTKDGVPIVLHDIHLESTTDVEQRFPKRARKDGRWYAIDFTLSEIKQLKVHERTQKDGKTPVFPSRFPVGLGEFTVPTLAEMIDLVKGLNASTGRKTGLYPEMKAPSFHREAGQDIVAAVLKVIDAAGYRKQPEQIIIQCFEAAPLRQLKKQKVPYTLVQLIGDNSWGLSKEDYSKMQTKAGLQAIAKYADGIGPWMNQIVTVDQQGKAKRTTLVTDAQALGLKVHPYTFRADSLPPYVNTFAELIELFLFEIGVDGLFTDFGDQAVAVKAQHPDQARGH